MLKPASLKPVSFKYFPPTKRFLTLVLMKLVLSIFFLFTLITNSSAAVILQYHHVGTSTPRSTSVTPDELRAHLNWLKNNNFQILPLPKLIELVKNKQLDEHEKIASITFDDINPTLCNAAWPILKEYQLPFTLFINTDLVPKEHQKNSTDRTKQCSWEILRTMRDSGLLSVGNHSQSHPHMLESQGNNDLSKNQNEILQAQKIIDKELGVQEKIFAYPYGEYNLETQELIKTLGYIGVGQQSGAIGNLSDLSALPRFPMSGQYANLSTLPDKLLSLPFPITKIISSVNPIPDKSTSTPELTLFFSDNFSAKVQCFLGSGEPIDVQQKENSVFAKSKVIKKAERVRYNCTAPSNSPSKETGRFYWYSYQWTFENTSRMLSE